MADAGPRRRRADDGRDADAQHARRGRGGFDLNYDEALAYVAATGRFGIKLGLERMRALLAELGNPEAGLTGALVAGTNGKGSTCAVAASILEAAGRRTGLMPSPHLSSYRERIQVGRRPVSEAEFAAAVTTVGDAAGRLPPDLGAPTEFELLTAAALVHMAPRIDVFVCEVGMGGRLDATNVLDLGVAVVTNVSLDHERYLGSTVGEIAAEKAGIVKDGNAVVTGCDGQALEIVTAAAAGRTRSLWRLGGEIRFRARSRGWDGVELDVTGPGFEHRDLHLPLIGPHQAANGAVAVAAVHAIGGVTEGAVRAGTASAAWPGRLELFLGSPRVVLDGAHNPAAMNALVAALEPLVQGSRVAAVFAAMADKDCAHLLRALRRLRPVGIFTTAAVEAGPRAAPPAELAAMAGEGAVAVTSAREALERAREAAGPAGTVVVCGSLYLAGELRPALA